jgi:hypothetical protein
MEVDSVIRLHHIASNATLPQKLRVKVVDDHVIQLLVSFCGALHALIRMESPPVSASIIVSYLPASRKASAARAKHQLEHRQLT